MRVKKILFETRFANDVADCSHASYILLSRYITNVVITQIQRVTDVFIIGLKESYRSLTLFPSCCLVLTKVNTSIIDNCLL